jgi:hypothetical protein
VALGRQQDQRAVAEQVVRSTDVDSLGAGEVPGIGAAETLRATSARVLELGRRLGGAVVLPGHDPGAAARLAAAGGVSA